MFNGFSNQDKDAKNQKSSERIETLIGENCVITGNISGEGLLRIDGSVEGDIDWADDIIIGSSCNYSGNISCRNAFIKGKITGNISCEDLLTIEETGKVVGDVSVKKIIINEDGCLDGKCIMENKKLEILEALDIIED